MENNNLNNQIPPASPISQTPPSEIKPKPKFKLSVLIVAVLVFLILIGTASAAYLFVGKSAKQTACTMEAKLCPDGTSVGRTGPNCFFAPCPTAKASPTPGPASNAANATANWKTYQGSGFSFKYPVDASVRTENGYSFMTAKKAAEIIVEPPRIAPFTNWYSFYVIAEDNNFSLDSKSLVEKYIISLGNSKEGNITAKKIESSKKPYVNGDVSGIIADYGFDYNYRIVIQTKNDKIYTFQITGDNGQYTPSNLKIFDQILSTFKFTDQTPTPTCMKRPACLDATPRCMIPEPASGWCP